MADKKRDNVSCAEFQEAVKAVRSLFSRHNVRIPVNSILESALQETQNYTDETNRIPQPATGSGQDDLAIGLGERHLSVWRLHESLETLSRAKVPKLRERLKDLAQAHKEHGSTGKYRTESLRRLRERWRAYQDE